MSDEEEDYVVEVVDDNEKHKFVFLSNLEPVIVPESTIENIAATSFRI